MNKKQYNNFDRKLYAAKIFLNCFNLILEEKQNCDESTVLQIFNKKMETVGSLRYSEPFTYIKAKLDNGVYLRAAYDVLPHDNSETIEFSCWKDNISFKIEGTNYLRFDGNFVIFASVDDKHGERCTCKSSIFIEKNKNNIINIDIQENGKTFYYYDYRGDTTPKEKELISVMPFYNQFGNKNHCLIEHSLKKGDYFDENNHSNGYPYEFFGSVGYGSKEKYGDSYCACAVEGVYRKAISRDYKIVEKDSKDSSEDNIKQIGLLMHSIDPRMYSVIYHLKELLTIRDLSLLDNLYSICYDSYSDEDLRALLGINRKKIVYQDGSSTLHSAYFGDNNQYTISNTMIKQKK